MSTHSPKGLLFVTSGPSGSGKTTLCRLIEKEFKIPHNVSYTTRSPRNNEVEGRDYHFISVDQFESMNRAGEFAECANVHGNRYGTAKKDLDEKLNRGLDIILDLDTQGALNIKKIYPDALLVFIDVSDEVLRDRLIRRGTENEEIIQKRLDQVHKEREVIPYYDTVVHNNELQIAYEELLRFIQEKKKSQTK